MHVGGAQAIGLGSRIPQPATTPSHRYPDVVTVEFAEDDEVRVALVYKRRLPSAPENVSVTAPGVRKGRWG